MRSLPFIREFDGYFNEYIGEDWKANSEHHVQSQLFKDQIDFIMELISTLKKQVFSINPTDTIITYEIDECVVPIIRFKDFDNISLHLYVSKDASSISIGWSKIDSLNSNDDLDMGHIVAEFHKIKDPQWKEHALEQFNKEFKRKIQITSIYVEDSLIKIKYHIQADNGKYYLIGCQDIADFSFWNIFKSKINKIAVTTLENVMLGRSPS